MLRLEAVNLSISILDTDDLSTRRGGGYMLLEAIRKIEESFSEDMKCISAGASIGLFTVNQGQDANGLAERVREFLDTNSLYRHATFVVDWATASDFRTARERAATANRWRQMQTLSVATHWARPPAPEAADRSKEGFAGFADGLVPVCAKDEVRPARVLAWFPSDSPGQKSEPRPLSTSVWRRRFDRDAGGRTLRQRFYDRELGLEIGPEPNVESPQDGSSTSFSTPASTPTTAGRSFTDDLQSLSNPGCLPREIVPTLLGNKIAVFYADGNGFGRVGRDCKSAEDLSKWDKYIRGQRKALLQGLLDHIGGQPRWHTDADHKQVVRTRFETLMWGGDELLFVVPAWCGIELARKFFELTRGMASPFGNREPLTHACSLVFAHCKAPIRRLEKLSHDLAEGPGKRQHKDKNSLSWMVLESFDHAGGNFDAYLERRYPLAGRRPHWAQLVLSPDGLEALCSWLPALKQDLPRSAMQRALQILVCDQPLDQRALLLRSYDSVVKACAGRPGLSDWWHATTGCPYPGDAQDLKSAAADSADWRAHVAAWTVLLELWDYII